MLLDLSPFILRSCSVLCKYLLHVLLLLQKNSDLFLPIMLFNCSNGALKNQRLFLDYYSISLQSQGHREGGSGTPWKFSALSSRAFACSHQPPVVLVLFLSALPVRHWRVNTRGRACTKCLPVLCNYQATRKHIHAYIFTACYGHCDFRASARFHHNTF